MGYPSNYRIVYQDGFFFVQKKRKFLFFTFWTLPSIFLGNISEMDFYYKGKLVKISEKEIEEWKFTGLLTKDVIKYRDWENETNNFREEV